MTDLSRRKFLLGASATAIAAAIPMPPPKPVGYLAGIIEKYGEVYNGAGYCDVLVRDSDIYMTRAGAMTVAEIRQRLMQYAFSVPVMEIGGNASRAKG